MIRGLLAQCTVTDLERAEHSSVVLRVDDLDVSTSAATEAGIAHDGPQPGGGARLLMLSDPDGNRVVLSGE